MIKRIFRSIFGGKLGPVAGKTDAAALPSSEEPKDEVVKGPSLPVEEGFTFTTEMGRRHNPKSPQLKAESLEHLWSGKDISRQASEAKRQIESEVRKDEAYQSAVEECIALDRSLGDFDDRDGHVVLPDRGFEFHGDRSSIIFAQERGKAVKNGNVYRLETSQGLIHLDNTSKDYNYRPHQVPVTTGKDFSEHTKVLESGEFQISSEGVVTLPSASSLEAAKAIESHRSLARQVEAELKWAQTVGSEADYRVDGFENDHDPRPGYTVASELGEYWFLKNCSLPHMKHQSYSVESGPKGTRLYEDSYDKQPELLLDVSRENEVTTLQAAAGSDKSLHLVWNKQAGTVKAELRAAEDWVEPKPEPLPKAQVSSYSDRSSFSSYYEQPRATANRGALPQDFTASGRIRSHGGGHHRMVKASGRFPNDQTYPEKFTDPDSGKSYRKTTYRKLDGSYLYVEN